MNTVFRALINRLKEPSSWSGFGLLFAAFGVPTGTYQLIAQVGMGLAGLVAVAVPEGKPAE